MFRYLSQSYLRIRSRPVCFGVLFIKKVQKWKLQITDLYRNTVFQLRYLKA